MSSLRLSLGSLLLAAFTSSACAAPKAPAITPAQPVAITEPAKPAIDRAALRAKLAERRTLVVDRFLAYREARVYPINNLPGGGTRHVWLDDFGHLCAAATLISQDWGRDAAINVGKDNRELKLAGVHSGPVADWILTSGLTHHEIVAIQVPGSEIMAPRIQRNPEAERMYTIYVDVERQLTNLADESLDEATDALMKRPELARDLLGGKIASAGKYAVPAVALKQ